MVLKTKILFRFLLFAALALLLGWLIFGSPLLVHADAILTIEPITWNVVGLDSNNVNVGPNTFPVGVRVCNSGNDPATNVSADFIWDSSDPYIDIRTGSLDPITTSTLAAGACFDFYFEIEITRDANAYDHTRQYHIEVSSNETSSISTPTPREIYVEHLISQSRNSTTDVLLDTVSVAPGGTMTLMLGETYNIQLVGSTATNGYEQIESYINFSNTIFQINSVSSTYIANGGTDPDAATKVYADGCNWENDPNSPNYRACLSTGKYGGDITVTYNVSIIGGAGTSETLNTLIYDFSGSSYHYNSDYSVAGRIAVIVDPSLVMIDKNFAPDPTSVTGTSTLIFTLSNPNGVAISGLNFTDTFPNLLGGAPGDMVVATPVTYSTNSCGTPTVEAPIGGGSFIDGAPSVSVSNVTVPANGYCTISVKVTTPAASPPDYSNITSNLFIDTVDTGNNASANLTVIDAPLPPDCTSGIELVRWEYNGSTFDPTYTNLQVSIPPTATTYSGTGTSAISTAFGNPINSWGVLSGWAADYSGYPNGGAAPYFEFLVDSSNFTDLSIQYDFKIDGNWANSASNYLYTYSNADGGGFAHIDTLTGFDRNDLFSTVGPLNASLTGSSSTAFRINAVGQQQRTAIVYLDNVVITGCGIPEHPTITKAFSPDPVAVGGTSTLTFTIDNPNPYAGLSEIAFSDTLPTGLTVAATGPITTCGGTLTTTAPDTITFSDGTLAVGGNCSLVGIAATATTAGPHINVSGYISSKETGTNYGPGGSASASLTAILPPVIAKQFAPNPILENGTSTLTITISNPNQDDSLTNVSFSDTFPNSGSGAPGNMVVAAIPNVTTSNCSAGAFVPALTGGESSVSFSGATVLGGGACTVTVDITAPTDGDYPNTSGAVTADITGGTDSASDTLTVHDPNPGISLVKQVSDSVIGPWTPFVSVYPGDNLYYRFVIENTGDVELTGDGILTFTVSVSDPTLAGLGVDLATECSFTDPLPVAVAADDNHITTCIVGTVTPIIASADTHQNTATASGTYTVGGITVADTSTATYVGVNPSISLLKEISTAAGGPWASSITGVTPGGNIYYRFTVNNTGNIPMTSVSVTDPDVDTSGCTFSPDPIPVAGSAECVVGPITAETIIGVYTNTASATVQGLSPYDPTPGTNYTSNDSTASYELAAPDLTVTKTNDTGGTAIVGVPFEWTLTVSNGGTSNAIFTDTQIVVTDTLPAVATYSNLGDPGLAGLTCSLTTSPDRVECVAGAAGYTLAATDSFVVTVDVTPTATGNLANTATVDPGTVITEVNETNNTGSDTVAVSDPVNLAIAKTDNDGDNTILVGGNFDWTITVTNNGGSTASFADTQVLMSDSLPGLDGYYTLGALPVTPGVPAPTGTINCTIVSGPSMSCEASGAVTLPAGASFSVTFTVTPTLSGLLANTAIVDPADVVSESDESVGDNQSTNTMTVTPVAVIDVSLDKQVTDETPDVGDTVTFTLVIANGGPSTATNIDVTDVVPDGYTYVAVSIAGGDLRDDTNPDTTGLTWTISSLASGATTNLAYDTTVVATGSYDNYAEVMDHDQTDNDSIPGDGSTTADDDDTVTVTVLSPPSISKSFAPNPITINGVSTLTFTIVNPNSGNSLTGVGFTDNLPGGLQVASTPNATTLNCGSPTWSPVAAATNLNFSGGTILASGTCTVTVDLTATSIGDKDNTSGVIASNEGGTGNSASDTLTVLALPSFSINDVTVFESDGVATFTVALSNPSSSTITVDYATSDNTAIAGADYTSTSSVLTFAPGETSKTVDIPILEDLIDEPAETFFVTLSNAVNSTIADGTGVGTILDNDPTPAFIINDVTVFEADGTATFTVALSNPSSSTITVDYATSDNTALAGADYTSTSSMLTFAPGEISKTVDVPILEDLIDEPAETFFVTLSNAVNSTIADGTGVGTILDNDSTPSLSINDVTVFESDGVATFTISLSNPSSSTITVDYATSNNTAIAGADYTTTSSALTFAPGEISKTVDVPILEDLIDEPAETFFVTLSNAVNSTIADDTGVGTILDNDVAPSISKNFSPNTIPVGGTSQLTLTLGNTNAVMATLTADFVDTLPAGVVIVTPNGLSDTCPGAVSAPAGGTTITYPSGSTIPSGGCTIWVDVTSSTVGTHTNTIAVGDLQTDFGINASPAIDDLTVTIQVPTLTKTFSPTTIPVGGMSTLTLTITNPNGAVLTGAALTDTYPLEIINETPANGATTCAGGVVTATDGGGSVSLSGGTVPANGSCTVTVEVTSGTPGTHTNATGVVTTNEAPVSGAASDTLTVLGNSSALINKTLVDTNQPHTFGDEVAIGEILTYEVEVTLSPGVMNGAELIDYLDRGLAFVNCESISAPPTLTTSITGGFTWICNNPQVNAFPSASTAPVDQGRSASFDFGNLTNSSAVDVPLTIRYRVAVLDNAGNVRGSTLDNLAYWQWTGGMISDTAIPAVVVEPELSLQKNANPTIVTPGTIITYTHMVSHTASSDTAAFDLELADDLPTPLVYEAGTLDCSLGTQDPNTCSFNSGSNALLAEWTATAGFTSAGGIGRVQLDTRLGNASPGSSFTNTATLQWSSLPGDISIPQSLYNNLSTERYYDPPDPVDIYGVQASAIIRTPGSPTEWLPATGFAPGIVSQMPSQPQGYLYTKYGELDIEIPSISLRRSIIGIPFGEDSWQLDWLWNQTGYLEGTAFPTWSGNTVITAHVYLPNGLPGPFVRLGELGWGDQVILHAFGKQYIYEVREVERVLPTDPTALVHEELDWVTLITCTNYDSVTDSYRQRLIVRAVLLRVE